MKCIASVATGERVGATIIETWVDIVHYEDGGEGRVMYAMTTALESRIVHTMK